MYLHKELETLTRPEIEKIAIGTLAKDCPSLHEFPFL